MFDSRTHSQPHLLGPAAGSSSSSPSLTPPNPLIGKGEKANTSSIFGANAQRINKKNASVACEACKVAKRKCDGYQPCSNCSANNKTCLYDPSQDGRRKQVRKRRLDELELRSRALDRILISLKHSSSSEARQLLDLIRRDASPEEILEFLEAHPGEIANETRAALSASPPPEDRGTRRMLTITELIDDPTVRVPAVPWTTVTKDDFLVSHLVSAYMNWYHWYYHNFDEGLFLDAMVAGNLDSAYCSPFLVNAVLGMGCMFTDHPAVFAVAGDPSSRGLHFYNEAHRLWSLEAARPTLTNIQGFNIMIMIAAFSGKDRVSTMSLKQLEVMIPQLLRQHHKSMQDQTISEDLQKSLKIVEWAAHIYSTGFGTGFLVPPTSPKPSLDAPFAFGLWQNHLTPWTPYPLLRDPIQLPLQALYHYVCELYLLAADVQSLVFADFATMNSVEKLNAARNMDDKLQEWYRSITPRFQFGRPDFILVPTTIDLALSLYHFRLMMWNWIIPSVKNATQPDADSTESSSRSDASSTSAHQRELDGVIHKAKEMCLEIISVTTRILQAADASFGPHFNTLMTPQTGILAASFLLSGNLDSVREEKMLLQIMRILVQCSRQRNLVKGVTHMLLKTVEDKAAAIGNGEVPFGGVSKSLLEQLTVIVKDLAWESRDYLAFSSQYPNHVTIKEDPDTELSQLLEKWADMGLHEGKQDKEKPGEQQSFTKGKEKDA